LCNFSKAFFCINFANQINGYVCVLGVNKQGRRLLRYHNSKKEGITGKSMYRISSTIVTSCYHLFGRRIYSRIPVLVVRFHFSA